MTAFTYPAFLRKNFFTLIALNVILSGILYVIYTLSCTNAKLQFLFPICSLLIILVSGISMAFKKNTQIGVRTQWSFYNKETWNKTQKTSAYITLLLGSVVFFATLTNDNMTVSAVLFIAGFLLDAVLCIASSYYYYQKAIKSEKVCE